jgi:hypothetical protein
MKNKSKLEADQREEDCWFEVDERKVELVALKTYDYQRNFHRVTEKW